ncbi:hypothetical protein EMIT079MI2_30222 [Bacillus sp. IT-79MI2]
MKVNFLYFLFLNQQYELTEVIVRFLRNGVYSVIFAKYSLVLSEQVVYFFVCSEITYCSM